MAENKKSFILYADQMEHFEELTNEEAGLLIKHIFRYVNDKQPEAPDRLTQIAFNPIKQQLKRDLVSYETTKGERSKSGILGNLKKHNLDLYEDVIAEKITLEQAQESAKLRKTPHSGKSTANTAVNVNDNVNVNDINNNLLSEIKISDVEESMIDYFKIAKDFQRLFINNLTEKNASIVNQQKATFKNYVDPIRLMIQNQEASVQDLRDVYAYLADERGQFWKANILSTAKLRKQILTLLMSARETKPVKKLYKS